MLPDQVSNPGPLTYESSALPIALRGPAVNLTAQLKTSLAAKLLLNINEYRVNLWMAQTTHIDRNSC